MLLLYPGELYRLLGASSYLGLSKNKNELMLLNPYPSHLGIITTSVNKT
jgi:hypothetical protein